MITPTSIKPTCLESQSVFSTDVGEILANFSPPMKYQLLEIQDGVPLKIEGEPP